MDSLIANIYRGKLIESSHKAIFLIKDYNNKTLISSGHEKKVIYPRSAIKIFQALPFMLSDADNKFSLTKQQIAISCSSHSGEKKHLMILEKWIKKLGINYDNLECGIHNPLNQNSSDKLLISGNKPTQLHNNCSGKHLGMISGCIANKMKIKNYTKLAHPYQKLIKSILEEFMEFKIKKKHIGIDGCSLP